MQGLLAAARAASFQSRSLASITSTPTTAPHSLTGVLTAKLAKNYAGRSISNSGDWVLGHIEARKSFAIETTLRSPISFEQARLARAQGFWTTTRYVSAGSVEESVKRVVQRSYRGGHSASERLIRDIYGKARDTCLQLLTSMGAALNFCGFTTTRVSAVPPKNS